MGSLFEKSLFMTLAMHCILAEDAFNKHMNICQTSMWPRVSVC